MYSAASCSNIAFHFSRPRLISNDCICEQSFSLSFFVSPLAARWLSLAASGHVRSRLLVMLRRAIETISHTRPAHPPPSDHQSIGVARSASGRGQQSAIVLIIFVAKLEPAKHAIDLCAADTKRPASGRRLAASARRTAQPDHRRASTRFRAAEPPSRLAPAEPTRSHVLRHMDACTRSLSDSKPTLVIQTTSALEHSTATLAL